MAVAYAINSVLEFIVIKRDDPRPGPPQPLRARPAVSAERRFQPRSKCAPKVTAHCADHLENQWKGPGVKAPEPPGRKLKGFDQSVHPIPGFTLMKICRRDSQRLAF